MVEFLFFGYSVVIMYGKLSHGTIFEQSDMHQRGAMISSYCKFQVSVPVQNVSDAEMHPQKPFN